RVALIGKRTASPSQARLDFIRDQCRAIVVGQLASARPKCRAHRKDAALALDWFDHYAANRVVEFGFEISDVVKAHEFDSRHKWTKWVAGFGRVRYGKRAERTAGERICKRHDASC